MALRATHPESELVSIALTAADEENLYLKTARELGVTYAVGSVNWYGEDSPYLDLSETAGPTYAFVIGRTGGVAWRGDPSRDLDEFLEAVRAALAAPAAPALPASAPEKLFEAVELYVRRDYAGAGAAAEKLAAKSAGRDAELEQAAKGLAALVDQHLSSLEAALEAAWTANDPAALAAAHAALLADFPKSDAAKTAGKRLAAAGEEQAAAVELQLEWLALRDERPALFPKRKEKVEKKYASRLKTWLKQHPEGPGATEAAAWLAAYEAK